MIRHAKAIVAVSALLSTLLLVGASLALGLQTHNEGDDLEPVPTGAFAFQGLAVDQSGGDIYAVDQFDPNTFAHGMLHRFGPDGSYDEAFATATASFSESLNQPMDVAVDNSGGGSDGRIYVADSADNRVLAIDESGAAVAGFGSAGLINGAEDTPGDPDTVPAGGFSFPCGVAVDNSNANLFVADQNNNRIWIFDSSGAYLGRVADSALNGPCGLALSSTGDLYVRNANDGKVLRFARKAATEYEFASVLYAPEAEPGATDVALDTATDHVYVDKGDRVTEYDSSGSPVSSFGQDTLGGSSGIAIDSSSFRLYAASGNRIATFGPLVTLPDVTTGAASVPSDTEATLTGTLDPAGVETTECRFEWGTDASYGNSAPCAEGDAFNEPKDVSAALGGLSAATTYHYRLVVANAGGLSKGTDRTFTTVGPPTLRSIEAPGQAQSHPRIYVTAVGASTATLNAELNPNGADTTWHFEYVDEATYQASGFAGATLVPLPDAEIEAGTAPLALSRTLSGLQADTPYRYRLLASNLAGPLMSPERSFRTDPIAGPATAGQFPGQGFLPDDRAWEMVTPPDKNGGAANAFGPRTIVAPDGNRVGYMLAATFGDVQGSGAVGSTEYVATRGPGGWSSHAITPKGDPSLDQAFVGKTDVFFSTDLKRGLVSAYDLPQVTGDISEGVSNLYREDLEGPANLMPLTPETKSTLAILELLLGPNMLIGGDTSFNRIFFSSAQQLLPAAPFLTRNVYEWDEGTLRLAGVLPGGSVPPGGSEPTFLDEASSPNRLSRESVSLDGSRILFLASMGGPRQLFMRKDHSSTTWVSEPEQSAFEPEGVKYQWATPDQSQVAFTTTSQLTSDDPGGAGEALYIYTDSPDPQSEANLEFVHRGGEVTVDGMSDDGTQGFFYSTGSDGSHGALFHWDEGVVAKAFGVLSDANANSTLSLPFLVHGVESMTRVSANGQTIAFLSQEELTEADLGFFFGEAGTRDNQAALYVYDASTEKLVCASCPPSGAPTSSASGRRGTSTYPFDEDERGVGYAIGRNTFLTADGSHVFFSSPDALVPEDVNGRYDAYEYDVASGRAHLLSSGRSPSNSWFASVSPSGSDAFIITSERLSANDVDNGKDLYDARVGGGLPEPSPPPAQCEGDACQPAPLTLIDQSAASETFVGPGDPSARHPRKHRRRPAHRHRRDHAKHRQHRIHADRRTGK